MTLGKPLYDESFHKYSSMTSPLERLDSILNQRLAELEDQIRGKANPNVKVPPMSKLLQIALKNEWETTLLTSHWIIDEDDADVRISLSRLAGDEAKHFSWIEKRLNTLGEKKNVEMLNERTPLFHHLLKQKNTFERMISGPYTREALAVKRNEVFLEHCKRINDDETITIYNDIQTDEAHHHELGRQWIEKNIQNEDKLKLAENIILDTLKIIDDIQEMAVMKAGICNLPGC